MNDTIAGVQSDDIVLNIDHACNLQYLSNEAVLTEKLDGGNCSIVRGKVCHIIILRWIL